MTQNFGTLRSDARDIFRAAVARVLPENCIPGALSREGSTLKIDGHPYPVDSYEGVYAVAFGKAAPGMFQALYPYLEQELTEAVVITNSLPEDGELIAGDHIRIFEGTHPLPSEQNLKAAEVVISLCEQCGENDLILFMISGGGSSLLFAPHPEVPLDEYQALVNTLMKKGATINELNTIRIVLSRVKGGRLLNYIHGAAVVNLIISDVIGDPADFIASGPTVHPRTASPAQQVMLAKSVLEKYQLYRKYNRWLAPIFDKDNIQFTDIEPDTYFAGSNRLALLAAKERAIQLGYNTILLSTMIEGESREVGHLLGTILLESIESENPLAPPCCVLSGGETTVTVTGEGKGGRNQELALGAADILREVEAGLILSAGTDGIDGPTDAAGAIVDSSTAFRAVHEGLSIRDSLYTNDSYHFFNALDDLVITGPTGTNVMDIQICLVGR